MMTVHLQIALNRIPPFKRQVRMRVPDNFTVEELVIFYTQKHKLSNVIEPKVGISILINGSRGSFEQKLKPNDKVKLFRPMTRG